MVNIIQGDGATVVGPIMESGDVDVLAFIGTSRVANLLKRQHPRPNRLRCILGLEAKNPAFILPDADLDAAVKECVARRALLQRPALHRAEAALRARVDWPTIRWTARARRRQAARPACRGSRAWQLTPLPEDGKADVLRRYVDDAVAKGARVVIGGGTAQAPSSARRCSTP